MDALTIVAVALTLAGLAGLVWINSPRGITIAENRKRMAEAGDALQIADRLGLAIVRQKFLEGYAAGLWFSRAGNPPHAIRKAYEVTMAELAVEDDTHGQFSYALGWALAVRSAYLRCAGDRHDKRLDPTSYFAKLQKAKAYASAPQSAHRPTA